LAKFKKHPQKGAIIFQGAFFASQKTGLSAPIFFAASPQKRISASIPGASTLFGLKIQIKTAKPKKSKK
jgi:hypothetical protein